MTAVQRSAPSALAPWIAASLRACVLAGLAVTMIDIDAATVARGRSAVSASLDRHVQKQKLSAAGKDAALARITGTTNYGTSEAATS